MADPGKLLENEEEQKPCAVSKLDDELVVSSNEPVANKAEEIDVNIEPEGSPVAVQNIWENSKDMYECLRERMNELNIKIQSVHDSLQARAVEIENLFHSIDSMIQNQTLSSTYDTLFGDVIVDDENGEILATELTRNEGISFNTTGVDLPLTIKANEGEELKVKEKKVEILPVDGKFSEIQMPKQFEKVNCDKELDKIKTTPKDIDEELMEISDQLDEVSEQLTFVTADKKPEILNAAVLEGVKLPVVETAPLNVIEETFDDKENLPAAAVAGIQQQ